MKTYYIDGTFTIRCDTAENWARTDLEGKGANRVLKLGELGWVIGTNDIKIGDGNTKWSELSYIRPGSEYAIKLGEGDNYYTYQGLLNIINNLDTQVTGLRTDVDDLKNLKNKYYPTKDDFPQIGIKDALYIDKSTDDIYYFDLNRGYKILNSFDILQASL